MNFLVRNGQYSLLVIVILGFALRIINPTIAFPILYMSTDEASYHLSALNMIAGYTPFTTGNYGPLGAYAQVVFISLSSFVLLVTGKVESIFELKELVVTHEGYFMFIPRIISALFGTLTILAVYRLTKELFGKKEIALLSALFCAISLNLVFISHQARAWPGAIFFSMLAVTYAIKATKTKSRSTIYSLYANIFSAISFGFYQIGGLVIILVLLITRSFRFVPMLSFLTLAFVFNFLSLGSRLFAILNPANKTDGLELVNFGLIENLSFPYISNFLAKLFLSDPIIVSLFLIFFLLPESKSKIITPFKIFILINLFLSVFIFPPFNRYFLLAFSFFPIFAGVVLFKILSKVRYKKILLATIVLAASFNSLYFNYLIAHKGTFSIMREWVDKNIPQEVPIIATSYRNFGYVPVESATFKVRETKPGYYRQATEIIGNRFLANTRFIIYADELSEKGMTKAQYTKKALSLYDAKIIIDSYLESKSRLLNSSDSLKLELVAHFSPTGDVIYNKMIPEAFSDTAFLFPFFKIERPGPYFDILRVK